MLSYIYKDMYALLNKVFSQLCEDLARINLSLELLINT